MPQELFRIGLGKVQPAVAWKPLFTPQHNSRVCLPPWLQTNISPL